MNVTILGCGLIGASWAALFCCRRSSSRCVRGIRPPTARAAFQEKVARAESQLIELGAEAGEPVAVFERIEEALWGADWVQENAPEKTELKAQLFGHVEAAVTRDCIIASSTSSFTWSQLASGLKHTDRFVIAHPFNPPHLVPLVELYSPNATTLDAAKFFSACRACARLHEEGSAPATLAIAWRRRCGARRFISSPRASRRLKMWIAC